MHSWAALRMGFSGTVRAARRGRPCRAPAAKMDLTQRTLAGAAERLGGLGPAMRIDARLHAGVQVLLVQLHADLLPARAGLGMVAARRQGAVGIVERRHHIEPVDERDRRGEQRAPAGRRALRALAAADRDLDRPVLLAR